MAKSQSWQISPMTRTNASLDGYGWLKKARCRHCGGISWVSPAVAWVYSSWWVAQRAVEEIRIRGIGKPAPEIEGEDLDGKPMRLGDYKGKVVLLDFWAFW